MTTTNTDEFRAGDETRSSAEIENDIRRTRGRMDATLEELGNRLTARSLLNSALDWWEERGAGPAATRRVTGTKAKHAYRAVARQVKDHPGPAALIGAGVAWLIMQATDDEEEATYDGNISAERDRYYSSADARSPQYRGHADVTTRGDGGDGGPGVMDKASEMAGQAKDAVTGAADTLRGKAAGIGEAVHGVAETVTHRSHEFYEQGRSASRRLSHRLEAGYRSGAEQFHDACEEYPLGVGLGFAALGALVGLIVPSTRHEDELLGEQSDRLVETAKGIGKETLEQGKQIASRVAEAAAGEAEKQGLTESATGAISDLAQKAGEVLRKARQETGAAVEELKTQATSQDQPGSQTAHP